MSSALTGKAGMVNWAAGDISEVMEWSLTYTGNTVEVTNFDSAGTDEHVADTTGWSGTFNVLKTGAPPIAMHASATLKLEETQTLNQFWTGTAIINGINETVAAKGSAIMYQYSFIGTGALTAPTA